MATFYSNEMIDFRATPQKLQRPGRWYGRARVFTWTYTTPAGGLAINDVIELVRLPLGFQVCILWFHNDTMGAGTTVSIGDSELTTRYAGGWGVSSAGAQISMYGLRWPVITAPRQTVFATVTGAAWAGDRYFNGVILGTLD